MRTRTLGAVCGSLVVFGSILGVAGGATIVDAHDRSQAATSALSVTSTLHGKQVLPHRIRWIARPSLPQARVDEVAFLIDGKVRWIERRVPYGYGDDGGYLVTSWLQPGRHRFVVRVRSTDGQTATEVVLARVRPAPQVPAALAGTWRRDVQGTPQQIGGPPGIYTLRFDRRWIQDRAPGAWNPDTGHGGIVDNDWVPAAKTFEIAGSVTFRIFRDEDAEGGWWCGPAGPRATYSWSVTGDTLTLKPLHGPDPCGERGYVYTGNWTRVR
ncbi:MAG TPA: hypothetical protein VJ689_07230 [Gaiellaceae bacterium]|nr:hypothetical protein [Gaiellaceae bacterium]